MTEASFRDGAMESSRLSVREPQWRLHDDGLLQPFYAVPDLYLVAEVERFSELDEPTGWYKITRWILTACSGEWAGASLYSTLFTAVL